MSCTRTRSWKSKNYRLSYTPWPQQDLINLFVKLSAGIYTRGCFVSSTSFIISGNDRNQQMAHSYCQLYRQVRVCVCMWACVWVCVYVYGLALCCHYCAYLHFSTYPRHKLWPTKPVVLSLPLNLPQSSNLLTSFEKSSLRDTVQSVVDIRLLWK